MSLEGEGKTAKRYLCCPKNVNCFEGAEVLMMPTTFLLSWVGGNGDVGPQDSEERGSGFIRLCSGKSFRPPGRGHSYSCAVIALCECKSLLLCYFCSLVSVVLKGTDWPTLEQPGARTVAYLGGGTESPHCSSAEKQGRAGNCKWHPSYKPRSQTTPVSPSVSNCSSDPGRFAP